MRRRRLIGACLQWSAVVSLASAACARGQAASSPAARAGRLTFGTTPVFLNDQLGFLGRWGSYLARAVGMPVEFIQRRAYRDIMALLRSGEIDSAWICGYPWVVNRPSLRGLAMPLYRGEHWYRSYLIVPVRDTRTTGLRDMRGRIYAFSDPDSNSGCLVPRAALVREGFDPDHFFKRTFFTWGHPNVVRAVGAGLADGGSVDGYVWDTLQVVDPQLTARTRVAWRSEKFGFPPLVVRAGLAPELEGRLREALLGMSETEDGRALLKELNLTGFGPFSEEAFEGIARNVALMRSR